MRIKVKVLVVLLIVGRGNLKSWMREVCISWKIVNGRRNFEFFCEWMKVVRRKDKRILRDWKKIERWERRIVNIIGNVSRGVDEEWIMIESNGWGIIKI